MPNEGLCARCHDIIEWKKKYRKYKPLTTHKRWYVSLCVLCFLWQQFVCLTSDHRSTMCQQKAVKRAYHTVCDACARKAKVCAKCQNAKEIVKYIAYSWLYLIRGYFCAHCRDSELKDPKQEQQEEKQFEEALSLLSERQRRSYFRRRERGMLPSSATEQMYNACLCIVCCTS